VNLLVKIINANSYFLNVNSIQYCIIAKTTASIAIGESLGNVMTSQTYRQKDSEYIISAIHQAVMIIDNTQWV